MNFILKYKQVNSDTSNCLGNWENYRKPDRLAVTSTANVLFVADSSNDGIIVIFFRRLRLCADAFSFVRLQSVVKEVYFFLLSPHATSTEVKQLIFNQRRKNNE